MAYVFPGVTEQRQAPKKKTSKPTKPKQQKQTVSQISYAELSVALPRPRKMTADEVLHAANERGVTARSPISCDEANEWTVIVYNTADNTFAQWGDDATGKGSFATREEADRVVADAQEKLGPQYVVVANPPRHMRL